MGLVCMFLIGREVLRHVRKVQSSARTVGPNKLEFIARRRAASAAAAVKMT